MEKFSFLLTIKGGENNDIVWDLLQKQFTELRWEDSKFEDKNIDEVLEQIQNIHSVDRNQMYDRKVKVFKAILSITHKNAECECVFSTITRLRFIHKCLYKLLKAF